MKRLLAWFLSLFGVRPEGDLSPKGITETVGGDAVHPGSSANLADNKINGAAPPTKDGGDNNGLSYE